MTLSARPGGRTSVPTVPSFRLPDRLYGRETARQVVLDAFERTSAGPAELLLVPGPSGVGKTSLILEVRGAVHDRNGLFLHGKFDQYRRQVPYFPMREALAGLCAEILAEPEDRRELRAERFKASVGTLGGLLNALVPEFEGIIGRQPPVPDIGEQEARYRFTSLLRQLFGTFCQPEQPVLLFLDDWQWSDPASIELLGHLGIGTSARHLLVVASYRDTEVEPSHALMTVVEDVRRQGGSVHELAVADLPLDDVRAIVADSFVPELDDPDGLARELHGQTRGNPFFLRSALSFRHESGAIRFDASAGRWNWTEGAHGDAVEPRDAVSLFLQRLRRLSSESQLLLSRAACLGNRIDVAALAAVSGWSEADCLRGLREEAERGLLKVVETGDTAGEPSVATATAFRFVHDRVQQAAYALIDPSELGQVRWTIGWLLLAQLPLDDLHSRLFDVVEHLNAGRAGVVDAAQAGVLVALNVAAAARARAATAYRSALGFARAAAWFVKQPGVADHLWAEHRDLGTAFLMERASAEFLEGDQHVAERCVHEAVAHARTGIERAEALSVLIVQYTLRARYVEAIDAGRQALAALGIDLPSDDLEASRDREIAQVREALEGRSVDSLADLPVMTDPDMQAAAKVLIAMGPPCYRAHQRLWAVIVPKVVRLTLEYGHIPQAGYSYPAFGGLLGWVDGDHALAQAFGRLATRLMTETFQEPSAQSVFHLMHGSSLRHWSEHLRQSSADYLEAYRVGALSGNLQYAAYAFGHDMYCRYFQGSALADLMDESERSLTFSRNRHNQWAIDLLEGGLLAFGALAADGDVAVDEAAEQAYLERVRAHQNIQVECIYKVLKAHGLLMLGEHARALVASDEAEPLIYTVGTQGLLPWPEHVFARFLILTANFHTVAAAQRNRRRRDLEASLESLRRWADHAPENFSHKFLLAAAELARIDQRPIEAARLYDDAIDAAATDGFVQWEALAHERAARFWSAQGSHWSGQVHWQQAYSCFYRWGASAKLRRMEARLEQQLRNDLLKAVAAGPLKDAWIAAVVGRQVTVLRALAADRAGVQQRLQDAHRAQDLAAAAERLRAEVAQRRQTVDDLRMHREMLEAHVSERLAEIEASRRELADARSAALNLMEDAFAARDRAQREVEERSRAEEEARRALADKEVLLHEIHHRVKNNLQIVSGLLNLQSEGISDPRAVASIKESQDRVMSIALVHEQLYNSSDLAQLDFGAYVRRLTSHLLRANTSAGAPVRLDLQVPPVPLDIDTAVPCGLIINELVTNAFKHAFRGWPDAAEARVVLVAWDETPTLLRLRVEDNGVGMGDVNISHASTLGLRLVQMLVRQLKGSAVVGPGPGCRVVVEVPKR